jgi:hypothetical protein
MTDHEIARGLKHVTELEATARQYWQAASSGEERDRALQVVRLIGPVQRELKEWITARALRTVEASPVEG